MKNILFALTFAAALSLCAMPNWNAQNELKGANVQFKEGVFTITGRSVLYSTNAMIVEPSVKYTVKMKMRMVPGSEPALAYAGFQPISKDGHYIQAIHLKQEKNTQATLLRATNVGDTQVVISTPTRWNAQTAKALWYLAIGSSGTPQETPHYDVYRVKDVDEDPEGLAIELTAPLKKAFGNGTSVCFHSDAPGMNTVANGVKLTEEWQEFSGVVQGTSDLPVRNAWWKGTHRARLLFMLLPVAGSKTFSMEVKDIIIVEEQIKENQK